MWDALGFDDVNRKRSLMRLNLIHENLLMLSNLLPKFYSSIKFWKKISVKKDLTWQDDG